MEEEELIKLTDRQTDSLTWSMSWKASTALRTSPSSSDITYTS